MTVNDTTTTDHRIHAVEAHIDQLKLQLANAQRQLRELYRNQAKEERNECQKELAP